MTEPLLFPLPVSPSPRLAWLMEHGVQIHWHHDQESPPCLAALRIPEDVMEAYRMEDVGELCYGHTEQEAVERLAVKQGWKLWNQ